MTSWWDTPSPPTYLFRRCKQEDIAGLLCDTEYDAMVVRCPRGEFNQSVMRLKRIHKFRLTTLDWYDVEIPMISKEHDALTIRGNVRMCVIGVSG